jgi:hypothetical protein
MVENKLICKVTVRGYSGTQNMQWASSLTMTTLELVSPFKFSTNFLSLFSASDVYSSQYGADVSPYLVAVIIESDRVIL